MTPSQGTLTNGVQLFTRSTAVEKPSIPISKNMEKLARSLFGDSDAQRSFLNAISKGESGVTAVIWLRDQPQAMPSATNERPEWLPQWIEVAPPGERPGKRKEHEEGAIYCMDLSSTFACAALSAVATKVRCVVDICASPGGKGIVAWRYFEPSLLVGNEVIGKRTAQLISNYKRCRIDPSIVTSLDPQGLAEEIPESGDLVIVDAPCSGQSLVLKGLAAPGAFHPATIGMNERRQRRILAHSAKVVAPGGYLLYSTCTFSAEENERNIEWFIEKFPEFEAVEVPILRPYRSSLSEASCYRLFPQLGKGAGAFCALLRKNIEAHHSSEVSPDSISSRLRTAWRSPTLYVSHESHSKSGRGEGYKVKKERRLQKYERHKVKRSRPDFEE